MPAGAVPKDGPSAGVAIAAALISLFRDQPIRGVLAMTGEVTLTGRILPVGGVREKILAARRAGIKTVLLPRHNEKDLVEIPAEVKADLTLRPVRHARRRRRTTLRERSARGGNRAENARQASATAARRRSLKAWHRRPPGTYRSTRPIDPGAQDPMMTRNLDLRGEDANLCARLSEGVIWRSYVP